MPRTNYDPPTSPGRQADIERYRRERSKKLKEMGWDAELRGLESRKTGRLREGDYRSAEEQAEQQDYTLDKGYKMQREYELNRMKAGPIKSGTTTFSTEDAANALANRKRRKR